MKLQIKSKILGKTLTFSTPAGYYIFVDLNGKEGSLGRQICKHGDLMGSTLAVHDPDDFQEFKRICHNWYRQYLKGYRQLNQDINYCS